MATGQLMGQSFITEARLDEILKGYATNQTLDSYLAKSGGTMTGPITLSGEPFEKMQATSKQYVDNLVGKKEKGWQLLSSEKIQTWTLFNKQSLLSDQYVLVPSDSYSQYKIVVNGTLNVLSNQNLRPYLLSVYFDNSKIKDGQYVTVTSGQKYSIVANDHFVQDTGPVDVYNETDFTKMGTVGCINNNINFKHVVYCPPWEYSLGYPTDYIRFGNIFTINTRLKIYFYARTNIDTETNILNGTDIQMSLFGR